MPKWIRSLFSKIRSGSLYCVIEIHSTGIYHARRDAGLKVDPAMIHTGYISGLDKSKTL